MFQISTFVFLAAAVSSLILNKNHKLCNVISNSLCVIAAALGLIASLQQILFGNGKMVVAVFEAAVPFLSFNIVIDNLSAFFLMCLYMIVFCVSLYSIGYVSQYYGKRNVAAFCFLYSSFILSMVFVISAGNAVLFFIAWEVMSLLSYFLVVFESEKVENQKAGTLYIIMTHIATGFLMIAFMIMFNYTKSFDMFGSSAAIPKLVKNFMFAFFLIGFGTKAGLVPVHIWLPAAHPAAPSNISALMSGIMIKTAVYGLLRFVFMYLGVTSIWWGAIILVLGMISAVFGVAYAYIEDNIKKLLAYSSIENIGLIFIGLGISFIALARGNNIVATLAITASLFHVFNHTLFKGSLFLGAGSIHFSTHTKNMEDLGGLIKRMPITALFMLGGSLSIASLIPFNGFVSEWLLYQSLFVNINASNTSMNILSILTVAVLTLSAALSANCYMKLFGISFLGLPRSESATHAKEVPFIMNFGMGILVLFCLIIGLFPMIFLKVTDGVVSLLTGQSIIGQLQGGFLIAYYPMTVAGNAIYPWAVLAFIGAIIVIALVITRMIGGKYIERKYGTWDCGYEKLTARMQCSATGFSKPIKIVFRILFRPSRELKTTGNSEYHPQTMEYVLFTSQSIFEKYIYDPIFSFINKLSKVANFSVQTGSIHKYLIYIFVTVLILMIYNKLA